MENFSQYIKNKLHLPEEGTGFAEKQIQLLFDAIKQTKNINEAELLFKKLDDLQYVLAKAVFKEGLKVTPFLRDFIYDFDRIDDDEVKIYQYQKIKSV